MFSTRKNETPWKLHQELAKCGETIPVSIAILVLRLDLLTVTYTPI